MYEYVASAAVTSNTNNTRVDRFVVPQSSDVCAVSVWSTTGFISVITSFHHFPFRAFKSWFIIMPVESAPWVHTCQSPEWTSNIWSSKLISVKRIWEKPASSQDFSHIKPCLSPRPALKCHLISFILFLPWSKMRLGTSSVQRMH